MDEPITPLPLTSSRPEQIFPTLTPAQVRRIAAHGQRRKVQKGEILVEQGDKAIPFFVVLAGELEAVRNKLPTSGSSNTRKSSASKEGTILNMSYGETTKP